MAKRTRPTGSSALVNTLRVLALLRGRKRGIAVRELIAELGVGRSSVYRYLDAIEPELPLRRSIVNGEARVSLNERAMSLTQEQLWAIALARRALRGLEGTSVADQLDQLASSVDVRVQVQAVAPHDANVASAVIDAIRRRRRLQVRYRGLQDAEAKGREIDPVGLHFAAGAWYVAAFDAGGTEVKTFKIARISAARVLAIPIAQGDVDVERVYQHSVAVWCGEPVDVAIRLIGSAARLAGEYPLHPAQIVVRDGDDVVVRATVAGLEEVTRWTLRWGASAVAVAPEALVRRVSEEIAGARENYLRSNGSSRTGGTRIDDAAK